MFSGCQCKKRSGRPFNFPQIEESLAHLRGRGLCSYNNLLPVTNPDHWWFEGFWIWPPKEYMEKQLSGKRLEFPSTIADADSILRKWLSIFKSIELISIIFRFVFPDHYGILSRRLSGFWRFVEGRTLSRNTHIT